MGPGLLGAGVTQLNLAVDVIIVSLLPPGSASLLYYADRVNQLPLGVIGTAVGTALLPLLSRQARGRRARTRRVATLNRALEITPGADLAGGAGAGGGRASRSCWCCSAAARSTPTARRLGAQSLAAYAFGLPAFVLVKVLVPAFFAHGDTAHAGAGRLDRDRAEPVRSTCCSWCRCSISARRSRPACRRCSTSSPWPCC